MSNINHRNNANWYALPREEREAIEAKQRRNGFNCGYKRRQEISDATIAKLRRIIVEFKSRSSKSKQEEPVNKRAIVPYTGTSFGGHNATQVGCSGRG